MPTRMKNRKQAKGDKNGSLYSSDDRFLQAAAAMRFKHTVFAAELALAEATVADYTLSELFAGLELATWLSGWGHFLESVDGRSRGRQAFDVVLNETIDEHFV
ncbi:hypothetical protein MGYG_00150 [Nannizzia gypsea CBS 118893]|uniref:Uncharacterized protein n=1 Tax=Arthroderma gypseum (strain ATCC MYA-4604 / CBS 118893) TaxID=535722 RepID=E5R378_ARTGP|nr:hypothetical protein MGYG_00150 [Nannizzia gypsea CBS 118893]EFQ97107.1 hypothetical protein MGYG_00150 [Nannizzia gypsea CBS 118893]